jgi:hypothetical protein
LIWVNAGRACGSGPFDLMQLKNELARRDILSPTQMEETMPFDVVILSAAIVGVFVIFGSVLYWGERRTRDLAPKTEGAHVKRRSF